MSKSTNGPGTVATTRGVPTRWVRPITTEERAFARAEILDQPSLATRREDEEFQRWCTRDMGRILVNVGGLLGLQAFLFAFVTEELGGKFWIMPLLVEVGAFGGIAAGFFLKWRGRRRPGDTSYLYR